MPKAKVTAPTEPVRKVKALALLPDRLGRYLVELQIPEEWIEELAVGDARGPHDMATLQGLMAQWAERQGQDQ